MTDARTVHLETENATLQGKLEAAEDRLWKLEAEIRVLRFFADPLLIDAIHQNSPLLQELRKRIDQMPKTDAAANDGVPLLSYFGEALEVKLLEAYLKAAQRLPRDVPPPAAA